MIKIEEIMTILPHRYPFVLIDRITHMDDKPSQESWVGKKCEAIKNVTRNENFFDGHFPERPVMPGVLIIEAMAQASAICGYRKDMNEGLSQEVLIFAIDNARFRRPVVPGDQLKLAVECTKDKQTILAFHCEASVDGERVAEADIMAKCFPRKRG